MTPLALRPCAGFFFGAIATCFEGASKLARWVRVHRVSFPAAHCEIGTLALVLTQPVRCPAGVPVRFPPTNMTSENALAATAEAVISATSAISMYRLMRFATWLVFPHELEGLSDEELRAKGGPIYETVSA